MRTLILSLAVFLSWRSVQAQDKPAAKCAPPSTAVTSSVTDYAMKKYHVVPGTQVKLLESAQANDECYWKYHFQAPQKDIVLYLAPDHRYLASALYDRLSDPLAEEKQQREKISKLLAGTNSPSRGKQNAAVTIVEFSDFQCPFCQRLTNILDKEVLPGEPDVRVVFRNYPLPMHPYARRAAEVAACAAMQNDEAFWALHDYIFSHQKELTADNVEARLTEAAQQQAGIDAKLFRQCIESGFSVGPVIKDEELGRKLGVAATPTLFINGSQVRGIRDAAQLKQLIADAREGRLPPATISTVAAPLAGTGPVAVSNGCIAPAPKGN